MIPARFDYIAADSAAHALDLLATHGDDAKVLAGGHSLLPMMKLRLAAPALLIDITRVPELAGITIDGGELLIGATTKHATLAASELVRTDAPLLAHAASLVGDPQIRHRGTIGGSLAHADPAADLPMAVVALGASLELRGPAGSRTVQADDFFTGYFETALDDGELLTAIRIPRRPAEPWGYQKFVRRANDWAIVGVAAAAGRIALANMGPVPLRAHAAEQALASGASPAQAAGYAADGTSPASDIHADPEYRRHLARVLAAGPWRDSEPRPASQHPRVPDRACTSAPYFRGMLGQAKFKTLRYNGTLGLVSAAGRSGQAERTTLWTRTRRPASSEPSSARSSAAWRTCGNKPLASAPTLARPTTRLIAVPSSSKPTSSTASRSS